MKKAAAKGKLGWFFPSNNNGQDQGLHNAGVETFKGDFYWWLAREIIQNSLDARHLPNKPVFVKFEPMSIPKDDLPGMDELAEIFDQCKAYWPDTPTKEFFKRAKKIATKPTIEALKIGDYNTSGVIGEDRDRVKHKNWYTLTRCSGSSSKEGGEGGSYGIGKNAPFAASHMRAVLYSTNTGTNKVAFNGVARLVTHANGQDTAHDVGYLGGVAGASIRDVAKIPKLFRRDERGTDVVILGFIAEENWEDQIRLSVLENFWPAIHFGDLEVQIGSERIKKSNIAKLLEATAKEHSSQAYAYYQCFKEPDLKAEESLPNLKAVSLYLTGGQINLPKKVAMIRKSGMVIYHRGFKAPMPFCGVFMCRNNVGNGLLRAMEPPRHDFWDANLPEKGANKDVQREFMDFIKGTLHKLIGKDDSKIIDIPELSRFLPDDDEILDKGGSAEAPEDKVEGFPNKPEKPYQRTKLAISKMTKTKPKIVAPDKGGGGTKGGGGGGGGGGNNNGEGTKPKTPIDISFRAFATDPYGTSYTITARANEKKTGMMLLTFVGDDARAPLRLSGAWNGKKEVPFDANGRIGPIEFSPGKPTRIDIDLETPNMLAMEGHAYEA